MADTASDRTARRAAKLQAHESILVGDYRLSVETLMGIPAQLAQDVGENADSLPLSVRGFSTPENLAAVRR